MCMSQCVSRISVEGGGLMRLSMLPRMSARACCVCVFVHVCVCGGGGGSGLTGGGEETLCHYTVSEGVLSQSLLLHCV